MQNDFFDIENGGEQERAQMPQGEDVQRVSILVPLPIATVYTYCISEGESLALGCYVRVMVGPRRLVGVVWDDAPDMDVPLKKLKPVGEVLDIPPMPEEHRHFIERVARYTTAPRGAVLKMSMVAAAFEPQKTVKYVALSKGLKSAKGLTPKRQRVYEVLADRKSAMPSSVLAKQAGVSSAIIQAMVKAELLNVEQRPEAAPCRIIKPQAAPQVTFSDEQQEAIDVLQDNATRGEFAPVLLDGVTGSGKTEVYFEAIAKALAQDQAGQCLVLLPEIALSDAFLARFEARFGTAPAVWHSALSPAQRRKTWRGVASGQTRIVIGARSALFLPFQRLKLIVVDEEHDGAFKQEDNVFYNARDMAVLRAFMNKIAVILISATPSLETVHNVLEGRYERAVLTERYGEAVLPHMHMIDMRAQKMPRTQFLSEPLREALAHNFQRGKQSLLFLNRRGYAPLTLCRSCGHRYECPQCSAWLVDHRKGRSYGTLSCHHCGFSGGAPKACQNCGAEDSLVPCGPGVERIAEEVAEVFPQMRALILSSDMKEQEDDLFSALEKIRQDAVDIIIGTQIIAKGHHFPNLTCVGVVDADLGMKGGDLRAAEHTWQLLQQVSGRAGRGEDQGHVYIQSYMPDNRLMETLLTHDRDGFLSIEMDERKMAFMPPFARLGALIISGKDEEKTALHARALAQWVNALVQAAEGRDIRVLGPAQAPIYMLRGRYRYRFLVQADKALNLQELMQKWVKSVKPPSDVKVQIDIDPLSFL